MSFKINGKNRSIERLIVRGKNAPARLKHMHVSKAGTTVLTPVLVARVTLPEPTENRHAIVIPSDKLEKLGHMAPESPATIEVDGEPAVDSANRLVPKFEDAIWQPQGQPAFVINGDLLRKVLTVAGEVTDDSTKSVRITYDKDSNSVRIDAFRMPGEQEFTAIVKCMRYTGNYLPGEPVTGGLANFVEMEKPEQPNLVMKVENGRKFRGAGE